MPSNWLDLLRTEVERTSISAVAARLRKRNGNPYSRTAVSLVLSGDYGDTTAIERAVLEALASVDCPHLGQSIDMPTCRAMSTRTSPPRQHAAQLRHWRACQTCPHRPATAEQKEDA